MNKTTAGAKSPWQGSHNKTVAFFQGSSDDFTKNNYLKKEIIYIYIYSDI